MRAVIIAGGEISNYKTIKEHIMPQDYIICADHGYDHALAMQAVPNAVIGDMDSVHTQPPKGIEVLRYKADKDKTDTHLAIDYAIEKGYKKILILGALGGRLDHSLANIMLLYYMVNQGVNAYIAAENQQLYMLKGKDSITLCGNCASTFSLFALFGQASGVCIRGAKYELNNHIIQPGSTLCISNELIEGVATQISVENGIILVINNAEGG